MTWAKHRRLLAEEEASEQRLIVRCMHCRWARRGKMQDTRRAFAEHREQKHSTQQGGPA